MSLSVELRGGNAEETRLNGCGFPPLLLATNAQSRLHITPILAFSGFPVEDVHICVETY
jgi:hypothetical protein